MYLIEKKEKNTIILHLLMPKQNSTTIRIRTTDEIIFECSCYVFQNTQNWRIQHWEELTNIPLLSHDACTNMNVEVKMSRSSSFVPLPD